jgi:hypothetical protein
VTTRRGAGVGDGVGVDVLFTGVGGEDWHETNNETTAQIERVAPHS